MEVTAIRPAVKNDHRANIFLNSKFAFSLDIAQLAELKLKVGQILDEAQLAELKRASNFGKLYQRTLEWVLARPRSVRETYDYLRRKKFQKPEYGIIDTDIDLVITRLSDKGYLNDQKFTEYYVENRQQNKGISIKKLRLELIKKGIKSELIEQTLMQASRDDEKEIQKVIAKKRRLKTYQNDAKLIQYLVRQGFSYELAKNSVLEMDWQNSVQNLSCGRLS